MITSLSPARELYLLVSTPESAARAVLMPDTTGIPIVVDPQAHLFRAVYLARDFAEEHLQIARRQLLSSQCDLFLSLQSSEGPPYRSGVLFGFVAYRSGISWIDEQGVSRHAGQTRHYAASTIVSPRTWTNDLRMGRVGYFLTGDSAESTLWRVVRMEPDAFDRMIFTLGPLQLAPNCPRADFSSVSEAALRTELESLHEGFCERVVQAAYRDVPTKARNIVEGYVSYKLRSQGNSATGRLGDDLRFVKGLLESTTRSTCGWQDLEYTLANKIRLVHGRTHPGAATNGQPLRPEFGLSIVEDLNELLRIWGFISS